MSLMHRQRGRCPHVLRTPPRGILPKKKPLTAVLRGEY
jgi:hypothetical protein